MTAARLAAWMLLMTIFGPLALFAVGASNILVRAAWRRGFRKQKNGLTAAAA